MELPALRQDLRLHDIAPEADGSPAWSIQDPVTNRFYRIGWLEFEFLLRWGTPPQQMVDDINASTALETDLQQLSAFARFLERYQLVRPTEQGKDVLLMQSNQPGWRHWKWWLHHYLFIRIPLIRPQHWLRKLVPWVAPLWSWFGIMLIGVITLSGVVMVAHQWDIFTHSVMDILTPAGISGFALAMILSKSLHELGHALVATRLGVRVSHMGVAFLVLWPMLYTDTGESWRLPSHRQRLAISVAGVLTELILAGVATFFWAILDDGALRQAMLYLATTGWVLSLALNVSPFMRFDGYFILTDILNFPNLHERSSAFARAWLRRNLLGFDEPDPEVLPAYHKAWLVRFALVTWLYRLIVFLGIALAVYYLFFKLLGIFLLGVELVWFIARPIGSELKIWLQRRDEMTRQKKIGWGLGLIICLALLLFPWSRQVQAPAVAHPAKTLAVFSPMAGQLSYLHPAGQVRQGDILMRLRSPELDAKRAQVSTVVKALRQRLQTLAADQEGFETRQIVSEQLRKQLAEQQALQAQAQNLMVKADFDGIWLEIPHELSEDVWLSSGVPVGELAAAEQWMVDAYVEQSQIERIRPGARAQFKIEGQWSRLTAHVVSIDRTELQHLPYKMLATQHGGSLATRTASSGEALVPAQALYRVRLELDQHPVTLAVLRGAISIEADSSSMLQTLAKSAAAVLIRESGF